MNNNANYTAPLYNNEPHADRNSANLLSNKYDPDAPVVPTSDDARAPPDLFAPVQPNVQKNSLSRRADRSGHESFRPVAPRSSSDGFGSTTNNTSSSAVSPTTYTAMAAAPDTQPTVPGFHVKNDNDFAPQAHHNDTPIPGDITPPRRSNVTGDNIHPHSNIGTNAPSHDSGFNSHDSNLPSAKRDHTHGLTHDTGFNSHDSSSDSPVAGTNTVGHDSGFNSHLPGAKRDDSGFNSHDSPVAGTNTVGHDSGFNSHPPGAKTSHARDTVPRESESAILADTAIAPLDDTPVEIDTNPHGPAVIHDSPHHAPPARESTEHEGLTHNRAEASHLPAVSPTVDDKPTTIDGKPTNSDHRDYSIDPQEVPDQPKVTHGRMDVFKGQMKKIAGAIIGNEDKRLEGQELKEQGKQEVEVAKEVKDAMKESKV